MNWFWNEWKIAVGLYFEPLTKRWWWLYVMPIIFVLACVMGYLEAEK